MNSQRLNGVDGYEEVATDGYVRVWSSKHMHGLSGKKERPRVTLVSEVIKCGPFWGSVTRDVCKDKIRRANLDSDICTKERHTRGTFYK